MRSIILYLLFLVYLTSQSVGQNIGDSLIIISDDVNLIKVTDKVYVHRSMMSLKGYGRFGCNGMLVVDNNEAAIVDTPSDLNQTEQLLLWLESRNIKVTSITVNHFHDDCLAGLDAFHSRGIPSYANRPTRELALADSVTAPINTFEDSLELRVGNTTIISIYPGEAHTIDNIVTYVPSEKALFGGCMMKSLKAGKGNLDDANVNTWSATIEEVGRLFPEMVHVIPGHGEHGK